MNLYAYCANNPAMYYEPSGFFKVSDVIDYYNNNQSNYITKSNNLWDIFRQIVGGQGFNDKLIQDAYHEVRKELGGEHYLHRNNYRNSTIEILEKEYLGDKLITSIDFTYAQAKANSDVQIDIGHKEGYEFWRCRNAAESLNWTQSQFNDFMNHEPTKKYQFEEYKYNISHKGECKSSDVSSLVNEMKEYQKGKEERKEWKTTECKTS